MFIESYHIMLRTMQNVDFDVFIAYDLIILVLGSSAVIVTFLICAYLFKHFQNLLPVD